MSIRAKSGAIAFWAAAGVLSVFAAEPVAVWNGNFSKLTRLNGPVAYTMNVDENASISADGSCITIGTAHTLPTVTITASRAGAFGSTASGGFTVVVRTANAGVRVGGNQAVICYYDATREAGAALAHFGQASEVYGRAFPMVDNMAHYDWTDADTLLSDGTIQTIGLSYGTNPQGGTAFYVDGAEVYQKATMTSSYFTVPTGISLGGVAIAGSTKLDASCGMVIHSVAIYTNRLSTAEAVACTAAGGFPAEETPAAISVSALNRKFGTDAAITVNLNDGDVVYGDVPFVASSVSFVCVGSFTLWAPAGNTATFDFSGVTGRPILAYGAVPTVDGSVFTATTVPTWITDATKWTGMVCLSGATIAGPNFNSYGNASSAIMLSGVSGWVNTRATYTVPLVLENGAYGFALRLTNGNSPYSDVANCSAFAKISGSGDLVDEIAAAGSSAWPTIKVYDASGFSGSVILSRASVLVCDPTTQYTTADDMFSGNSIGHLRIESGKAIQLAAGKTWSAGHIVNNGTLTGAGRVVTTTGDVPGGTYVSAGWTGTVVISNVASATPLNLQNHGTADSMVLLTAIGGTSAYLPSGDATVGRVTLEDAGDVPALSLNDGFSNGSTVFAEIAGTGTFTQSKAAILQGVTINVLTNFTGTLAFNKMTVTFGTARRKGQKLDGDGNWIRDDDTASRLFIDPDADVALPAGFALWSPEKVVFNGTVRFTTADTSRPRQIVLLTDVGPEFTFGDQARILLNGAEIDALNYSAKVVGTELILKRKVFAVLYR